MEHVMNEDHEGEEKSGGEPELPDWFTMDERKVWRLEGFDQLPAVVSVPTAAKLLGISRSTGYSCVHDGTIRACRLRRRLVIPRLELFMILHRFRPPHGMA